MNKSVFTVLVFAMLFTLASAEEIAAPWKNIENLKQPNGRVEYFSLDSVDGELDIVRIKSFSNGFVTYYSFGPNFEVKENIEPIYKFTKIVYDNKTRIDLKRMMGHILSYYEDRVFTADNDYQINFLKGFSEFLIRTGSLGEFIGEWKLFLNLMENLKNRKGQMSPDELANQQIDLLPKYRFYSSFILFVLCSIDYNAFKKIASAIEDKQVALIIRIKKFIDDLESQKDELHQFMKTMMDENPEFAELIKKVRSDVSNWSPEAREEFLNLLNRRPERNNPNRPGGGNGGPNRQSPRPNI